MPIDELAQGIGGSRDTVNRAATEVPAMKAKAEEHHPRRTGQGESGDV